MKQLVRNSAMPCPTFCDIQSHNKAMFVPMSDVFPAFDALLSENPVPNNVQGFYVPKNVSHSTYPNLWSFLFLANEGIRPLFYYQVCKARRDDSVLDLGTTHLITTPFVGAQTYDPTTVLGRYNIYWNNTSGSSYDQLGLSAPLNANSADFIFVNESQYGTDNASVIYIKLSGRGRRLFKIFYGLGYSMDPLDNEPISILPLFAYYKAWFDSYAPLRYVNWHATHAYELIREVYNDGQPLFKVDSDFAYSHNLQDFLNDLADCFYTDKDDYVSVHTSSIYPKASLSDIDDSEKEFALGNYGDVYNTGLLYSTNSVHAPYLTQNRTSQWLNAVALRTLFRFSKYITKDSLIGRNVQAWVKAHFGAETCEDMFREAHNLGDFIVDAHVDEIFSTSDTVNGDVGEHLGSYAGKGIGFGNGDLKFQAPTFGFVFIMQSIVSNSDYYQGSDPYLDCIDKYTFPDRAFDALGYEVTPQRSIYDQNGFFIKHTDKSEGFGFIPRYSGLKITKSLLNGLARFNSERSQYDAFHLCRIVKPTSFTADDTHSLVYHYNDVPNASVAWRFNGRYTQLTDYDRIFAFKGDSEFGNAFSLTFGVDNFIVQMVIEGNHRSILKPITESYDVFDSEDTSQQKVSAE